MIQNGKRTGLAVPFVEKSVYEANLTRLNEPSYCRLTDWRMSTNGVDSTNPTSYCLSYIEVPVHMMFWSEYVSRAWHNGKKEGLHHITSTPRQNQQEGGKL